MTQRTFDINCDLGESFGNWSLGQDEEVMPLVTSANVACGFHAGDPVTMARTVALAMRHGVAVGAHPGLPDLLGFGRRLMAISPDDAAAYVRYQAGALQAFLRAAGGELNHVKPHGAFFELLRDRADLARPVAHAVRDLGDEVMVYWPAPAEGVPFCEKLGQLGVRVVGEIYPDLSYAPDGRLVIERSKVETDVAFAAHQTRLFIEEGVVEAVDGSRVPLTAGSACIHGDGPNAVAVARAVRHALTETGHQIAAAGAAA
ncbi:MAG: pxpA [Conexibacter sp.]|nr:pxpA [Conexibacter sp.]